MDKYDEAIEFLQSVDPGSYFDECAALMEELLAQVELSKEKKKKYKPSAWEVEHLKQLSGAGWDIYKRRKLP